MPYAYHGQRNAVEHEEAKDHDRALEDLNPEKAEKLKADEEVSELSDDALGGVSGGYAYTSMDGYTVDDGFDPQTDETIRLYLES